jgi:alkylation response protein AidB-like acyl-CoA dehydrogenase
VFWRVCHHFHILIHLLTSDRTEPNTGLETLKLRTLAKKDGDSYIVSGQKM